MRKRILRYTDSNMAGDSWSWEFDLESYEDGSYDT